MPFIGGNIMQLIEVGKLAKEASIILRTLSTEEKNNLLYHVADELILCKNDILKANEKDIQKARENGMQEGLLDRLRLNLPRLEQMAEGLRQVAALQDPIGEVLSMKKRPNGLLIGQQRVAIGVIGIIYEARPNVTIDAFSLCFKTGNAVVLKGGSDAFFSNQAIVKVVKDSLKAKGLPINAISFIEDNSRENTLALMKLNQYLDLLIPRGGAGLIRSVVENSTIPVIETGTGNCHIYVDESADISMAVDIIHNAKTQRIGVCNACESIVVHEKIAPLFLPVLEEKLKEKAVELRGDKKALLYLKDGKVASEDDWGKEYLDYIASVKTVSDIDEAIDHINRYNTKHSEAIITNDYKSSQKFLNEIDAAAVYVNASTRFTDGFEFGFGAEIGISTQKMHARGPMGLLALTTTKYIIYGSGQVRP